MPANPTDVIQDELRALLAKATPGPWCWEQCGDKQDDPVIGVAWRSNDPSYTNVAGRISDLDNDGNDVEYDRDRIASDIGGPDASPSSNAALIVAAVNALPALLDRLVALQAAQHRQPDKRGSRPQWRAGETWAETITKLRKIKSDDEIEAEMCISRAGILRWASGQGAPRPSTQDALRGMMHEWLSDPAEIDAPAPLAQHRQAAGVPTWSARQKQALSGPDYWVAMLPNGKWYGDYLNQSDDAAVARAKEYWATEAAQHRQEDVAGIVERCAKVADEAEKMNRWARNTSKQTVNIVKHEYAADEAANIASAIRTFARAALERNQEEAQ